jgi:hypothetical protein
MLVEFEALISQGIGIITTPSDWLENATSAITTAIDRNSFNKTANPNYRDTSRILRIARQRHSHTVLTL